MNIKAISKGLTHRGYSENVFVIAKNEQNEWCDPIIINKDFIAQDEQNLCDEGKKERKIKVMTYENYNKYKYKKTFGIDEKMLTTFTYDNLTKIAYRSDMPIPLINYKYNSQIGLYHMNDNNEF